VDHFVYTVNAALLWGAGFAQKGGRLLGWLRDHLARRDGFVLRPSSATARSDQRPRVPNNLMLVAVAGSCWLGRNASTVMTVLRRCRRCLAVPTPTSPRRRPSHLDGMDMLFTKEKSRRSSVPSTHDLWSGRHHPLGRLGRRYAPSCRRDLLGIVWWPGTTSPRSTLLPGDDALGVIYTTHRRSDGVSWSLPRRPGHDRVRSSQNFAGTGRSR